MNAKVKQKTEIILTLTPKEAYMLKSLVQNLQIKLEKEDIEFYVCIFNALPSFPHLMDVMEYED